MLTKALRCIQGDPTDAEFEEACETWEAANPGVPILNDDEEDWS